MTVDTATTQGKRWKFRSRVVAGASALALTALGIQASPANAIGTSPTTITIDCTVGAPFTYTGAAQTPCTYTIVDPLGPIVDDGTGGLLSYSSNTNAGTATATVTFAGDDTYDANSGTETFVIGQADAAVSCTPYDEVYDATEHTASCTAVGVDGDGEATGGSFDVSGTAHTDAGIYDDDAWSFEGGTNYLDESGTVDNNIDKADADVSVVAYDVDYDGTEHTSSYTVVGVGSDTAAAGTSLDVSNTSHTAAGTYDDDAWSFEGGTNYLDENGTVDNEINPLVISTGTYTGAIAVPYGAKMALKSSFSMPSGCSTNVYSYEFSDDNGNNYNYYTSDGGVLQTPYTTAVQTSGLPSGPYLVRANYKGDSNCNQASSDTPGFVVYDASTAAYGGGQYVSNGRANFGFEYHAATRTRAAGGNLVWNWKGQWRFKGKLNAYGKRTSGTLGERNCTSTNPCGAFTGTGTLFYYNSESLTWVSVGSGITVNVAAIQTTTTAKNSSPGYVGFSFGYIPVTGQPSLPSNALISLQKSNNGGGGVISLK